LSAKRWMLLVCAALLVAGVEIGFHVLMAKGAIPSVRAYYLYVPIQGRRPGFAWDMKFYAPAAFLGAVNGWLGYKFWSPVTIGVNALGVAVMLTALTWAYGPAMGHKEFGISAASFAFATVTTFFTACFFSLGAYVYRLEGGAGR